MVKIFALFFPEEKDNWFFKKSETLKVEYSELNESRIWCGKIAGVERRVPGSLGHRPGRPNMPKLPQETKHTTLSICTQNKQKPPR